MVKTTVQLFKDLGFNSTYNYTIDFENEAQRTAWFDARVDRLIDNANYNKLQNKANIEIDIETAQTYTYAKILVGTKWFYCWIISAEVSSERVVTFSFSIDYWQTYLFQFSIGESNVIREHRDRYKTISTISTLEWTKPNREGGNFIYLTEKVEKIKDAINPFSVAPYNTELSHVVMCETTDNKYRWWIFPIRADGKKINAIFNNVGDVTGFPTQEELTDGNIWSQLTIDPEKIALISLLPTFLMPLIADDLGDYHYKTGDITLTNTKKGNLAMAELSFRVLERIIANNQYQKQTIDITNYVPKLPHDGDLANDKFEPQLFREPYQREIITNELGYIIQTLLPSSINTGYGVTTHTKDISCFPMFSPTYLKTIVTTGNLSNLIEKSTNGDAVSIDATNVDVLSSVWQSYQLNERSQDRQILLNTSLQNTIESTFNGAIGGGIASGQVGGSGLVGLAGGAVFGAASGLVNMGVAFANQDLKEQKIKNQPSKTLLAGVGYANIVYDMLHYNYVIQKCDKTTYKNGADLFRKYGYEINKYETPNIRSRKYYNYILTNGCQINGSLNQNIKDNIAQIFNSGTTIWHMEQGDVIGNYMGYENIERSLM